MNTRKPRIKELKLEMAKNRLLKLLSLSEITLSSFIEEDIAKQLYIDIFNSIDAYPIGECIKIEQSNLTIEFIQNYITKSINQLNPSDIIVFNFLSDSGMKGINVRWDYLIANLSAFMQLLTLKGVVDEFAIISGDDQPVIILEITEYQNRIIYFEKRNS